MEHIVVLVIIYIVLMFSGVAGCSTSSQLHYRSVKCEPSHEEAEAQALYGSFLGEGFRAATCNFKKKNLFC